MANAIPRLGDHTSHNLGRVPDVSHGGHQLKGQIPASDGYRTLKEYWSAPHGQHIESTASTITSHDNRDGGATESMVASSRY